MPKNPPRNTELYEQVPDRAKLEVRVGAAGAPFTSEAKFFTSAELAQEWTDGDLRPGPKKALLRAGKAYFLSVRLKFQAQTAATIDVQITKPDGTPHSTPIHWDVNGTAKGNVVRGLFIQMA